MTWKIVEFGNLCRSGAASDCSNSSLAAKSVGVVPEKWLFKKGGDNFCYWPPSSSSALVISLARKIRVPHIDWEVWSVTQISKETISDYELAREILQGFSGMTDIDSYISLWKANEYGYSPKKESFTEEDENHVMSSVLSDEDILSIVESHTEGRNISGSAQRKRICIDLGGTSAADEASSSGFLKHSCDVACQTYLTQEDMVSVNLKMDQMLRTMRKMEQTIGKLYSKVVSIETGQKDLMEKVTTGFSQMVFQESADPVVLPFELPIRSFHQFSEAMAYVQKPEILEQLMNDMSRVGGKNDTAVVNGILGRIMSNGFAKECSWKGQRNKKYMLDSTPLLKIVHGSAIRNTGFRHLSEEDVKMKIQNWLKQAGRRKSSLVEEEDAHRMIF